MPTTTFSSSPKLDTVMKDFIEKLQHSLDQLFLFLLLRSLVVYRRKMPVRELAH